MPRLSEQLAWLDAHWNMEAGSKGLPPGATSRTPTLARVRALLELSGDPQTAYPVIHLTGTNGKTSTTRLTASLLSAMGIAAGTFTSPHLERINERFGAPPLGAGRREAGSAAVPISDDELAEQLHGVRSLEALLPAQPDGSPTRCSWFELVTALAFRWFADLAVDAAVVEVGVGGEWDCTNVADGVVAVLTNVGLDHVEYLGPTREDIARTKAGIVKEGATFVCGEPDPAIGDLLEAVARDRGAAEVWRVGRDFAATANDPSISGRLLDLRTPGGRYQDVDLLLHGRHQGANAAVALAAVEAFLGAPLPEDAVREGLGLATSPGRMEVVGLQPLVVLDGAHNLHGAAACAQTLDEEFGLAKGRIVVLGMLAGHDEPGAFLDELGVERIRLVVGCDAPSPRAVPADDIVQAARERGIEAVVAPTVEDALDAARADADDDDLVLVTGSLYVVGAARTVFAGRQRPNR